METKYNDFELDETLIKFLKAQIAVKIIEELAKKFGEHFLKKRATQDRDSTHDIIDK